MREENGECLSTHDSDTLAVLTLFQVEKLVTVIIVYSQNDKLIEKEEAEYSKKEKERRERMGGKSKPLSHARGHFGLTQWGVAPHLLTVFMISCINMDLIIFVASMH